MVTHIAKANSVKLPDPSSPPRLCRPTSGLLFPPFCRTSSLAESLWLMEFRPGGKEDQGTSLKRPPLLYHFSSPSSRYVRKHYLPPRLRRHLSLELFHHTSGHKRKL